MKALIVDSGQFLPFAEHLSKSFETTYFFREWDKAYPLSNDRRIGENIPGLTRIDSPKEAIDDIDILIHLDVAGAADIDYYRDHGLPCWGVGLDDSYLELSRHLAREAFAEHGMNVIPGVYCTGMDEVLDYLKGKKDKWVKASHYRGDWETKHWISEELSLPVFERARLKMGLGSRYVEFLIEDSVPGIEPGYDGYIVNGKFPLSGFMGFEIKDKGYVGKFDLVSNMPKSTREVNSGIEQMFSKGLRCNFSHEYRIAKDKKVYLTDPCMRCGSPPSESLIHGISNWGEIVINGAQGKMVQPKMAHKYIAQIMLYSDWAQTEILPVYVPKEFRDNIELRNYWYNDDGIPEIMPQGPDHDVIGAAVGYGDTLKAAIDMAQKAADAVEYTDKEIKLDLVSEAPKVINEAKQYSVIF